MAGISQTGQPSVRNYTLLKGELMVSFLDPDTSLPTSWRSIGNSCETTLTLQTTVEPHHQCLTKVRTIDLEYITELNATTAIRMDEWMFENLAIFTVGESRARATFASGTGILNATGFVVANANATVPLQDTRVGGRWYDIGVLVAGPLNSIGGLHDGLTHDRRLYGVTATSVEITANAIVFTGVPVGTPTTATTFTVNEEMGMLFIESGGALETAIIADLVGETTPTFALPFEVGPYLAQTQDEVSGLTGNQVALAIKIVGINGANAAEDELLELTMFQVIFRPDGDLPLFAETELGRFTVTGTLQQNRGADPAGNGYFTLRKVA